MSQRMIPAGEKYESMIYVLDEEKLITKLYCKCGDFSGVYTPEKIIKKICTEKSICFNCIVINNKKGCNNEFDKLIPSKFYHGRRIKKFGESVDNKIFSTPCKHLKPFVERLIKQGYKLKKPEEMTGEDYLKPKLRRELMERANNSCEQMKVNEEGLFEKCCGTDRLNCHRKLRGSAGGKYNMKNCIILCWYCHKGPLGVHSNEFGGCKGK